MECNLRLLIGVLRLWFWALCLLSEKKSAFSLDAKELEVPLIGRGALKQNA